MSKKRQTAISFRSEGGFTLIDLSIAMMVISILMLPILKSVEIYYRDIRMGTTDGSLGSIEAAMDEYFLRNGFYPCPADPSLNEQNNGYGRALPCNAAGDPDPAIGAVPFVDLRLPVRDSLDGYKNKITYVVDKELTDPATFSSGGSIVVREMNFGDHDSDPATDDELFETVVNNAHFILISHGANDMGAFSAAGVQLGVCTPGMADSENCNGDNIFLAHRLRTSDVPGANFFDDRTMFQTDVDFNVWQTSEMDVNDIFTNQAVLIGIGDFRQMPNPADSVLPEEALDVDGNILTAGGDTMALEFCIDSDNGKCFESEMIQGSGTGCAETADAVKPGMSGIKLGSAACDLQLANGLNVNCGNKMVTGIGPSGELLCAP